MSAGAQALVAAVPGNLASHYSEDRPGRIAGQDNDVRQIARRNPSQLVVLKAGGRGPNGVHADGILN